MTLDDRISALTASVVGGTLGLDQALSEVERWIAEHAPGMNDADRAAFNETLDRESTHDNRSLVDSVLRLHATRLLVRHDTAAGAGGAEQDDFLSEYNEARDAFYETLRRSENGIRETRMDIAIANAHHLLGDVRANREWLDSALARLQPLASLDLVGQAEAIPAMPLPRMGLLKRAGLRLLGMDLSRLSDRNRDSFVMLAQLQTNQIVLLAHLIGTSFEAVRERQRANRTFRIIAHLVARYDGLPGSDAEQMLTIAEDIRRVEPEAARQLAQQAHVLCRAQADKDGQARAQRLLEG